MTVGTDQTECPCCLGDPDLVCDKCGDHACWAGIWMCQYAITAGVVHKDQWCGLCNYDLHECPGCGISTPHEKVDVQTVCASCDKRRSCDD